MPRRLIKTFILTTSIFGLAACGGGGGGGSTAVVSTPTPSPSPTPSPTPTPTPTPALVQIFNAPTTQQFAAFNAGPGNLQVRYDSTSKLYEVSADGGAWAALREGPGQFEFGSASPANWMAITAATETYAFSKMADWSTVNWGIVAFGIATPSGAVPVTGSANYGGVIQGISDTYDLGGPFPAENRVGGTIDLSFNFAAGSLTGAINPILYVMQGPTVTPQDLGTFAFKDTVFGVGSTSFSGAFDTTGIGLNSFAGIFTGPSAQEAIGDWKLPFIWTAPAGSGIPADGEQHQAVGVFVARR